MRTRTIVTLLFCSSYLLAAGCTDREGTVKPDEPAASVVVQGQEAPGAPSSGEIQERAIPGKAPVQGTFSTAPSTAPPPGPAPRVMVPGVTAPPPGGIFLPPPPLPGEFAIQTPKAYYLTAIDGGGRITDPIVVTAATTAGPWEKFKILVTNPSSPYDKSIQTAKGNYLTAVSGGGLTANVFHTDAIQANDWEKFRLLDLGVGGAPGYYAVMTVKGFYVTAVGAGGRYADALHTDAKQIQAWEQFRIEKCGDPGSGYAYAIMAANGELLAITHWQGKLGFGLYGSPAESDMKYKFMRQSDGTYAFQTVSGNYVTALGGGGQVATYDSKYYTPDCGGLFGGPCIGGSAPIFHTDATQVQAWEKFRIVDQGNCTYAIQTSSGFFAGIYKDSSGVTLLTTRRDGAPTANERFQLVVFGLASPVVLQ